MTGMSRRLCPTLLLVLFAVVVAVPAFAADVTINGTVNFSALDGGPDDADHAVNGVFTVTGNLVINGTILCIDDSGRESACPMSFNVGHDLTINAGGAVFAENRTGTGTGAPITFTVGHDFVMHGPTNTLAGAIVSSDSTSSSSSHGGDITANVAGAFTIESGATIDSGSANAAAGAIAVTAGGHIDASGNVLAGPSRTILSTRLTDLALSGGTGNQAGGAITLNSTSFIQPGLSVGSNANIISQGQVTSAGPVTLQGCGVVVNGLVASLATKDATSRVVIRSGKSITVDGRDLGVSNATLGRNGMLRGDAPTGTAVNHVVDLFAFNDITVLGPDPSISSLAAITGTPGLHDSKSVGAKVRVISLTGGVTASGNVIADGRTNSGDDGGDVSVSAQGNLNLDHAVITSVGDAHTNNTNRGGGTITLRSYSGGVTWTNGTGDVRPTGSDSGLPSSAQGQISITACGAINLSGSTFPTNGPPVGVWPAEATACSPAAPALPVGEPALPVCCNVITITNPSVTSGIAGSAFSQAFTQTGAIGTATFSLASGTLPSGLTLASDGTLSGTPVVVGTFPIVVQVVDSQGCSGIGTTYTLTINCQTITVNNPSVTTTVAASPFSATFTQSGAIGGATFSTTSVLPTGLVLSGSGLLSGTPTVVGTFPIIVTATDGNGCTGSNTYNLTITCQTITVTNPGVNSGTVNVAFSQTFAQSGSIGTATFSESGALPAGLTFASNGTLSGTPTQTGSFPIVVTTTDVNGCTGHGATYTLTIACQVIPVTNPSVTSGTVNTPFSAAFTASNTIGTTTFSTASALPAGLTLASNGTLSGTPTQTGTFPIVVTATDANGCSGTGATYTLTIHCQVISVTNPSVNSGTAGSPFSATFTASNTIGAVTFSTASTLPAGISLSSGGVLSGTPTVVGTFPIVVTATDANGCTGSGATYNLTIHCQTISVTNPANASGIAGTPFSATFTASNTIGTTTFGTASVLPAGLALSAGGVLSGTPLQVGSFPIVVTATDGNGCSGSGATYTLVIGCQVITVTNPSVTSGTANTAFSVTFTASNTIGATTFSTASTLPAGLTLASNGTLSGTPTQTGTFPIVVTATDGNGCSGNGATYSLVIACQTITVTNPSTSTGTVNSAFSAQFTASNTIGTTTFSTASTLPTGLALASDGTLSGTPLQPGTFPVVVTVTDANGCSGTSATYTLVIACQTITVTNPANAGGTVASPFSETFTQSGAFGTATFTTASALPAGLSLSASTGVLSGTPTQSGTFPIVVTVTDSNGCSGSGPTYTLVIACNVITVTNPASSTFTAGQSFSVAFTQSGANGTVTWSKSGVLPAGVFLNSSTGVLAGTASQTGSFPITVTATDANGCSGSSSYTLTIVCQTITITNPATTSGTAGTPFSATFSTSGIIGTATWSKSGALPSGITLNASTGVLAGTTSQTGSFPIVVTVTDTNGCSGSSSYTLTIACQTITVTNPATTTGTAGTAFSQTFTATTILGTPTWSESGTLPGGLSFNSATGVLSGTPNQTGTFPIVVTVTDSNGCSGTGATYTLVIACPTITVTRVGGGGSTLPPATFGVGYPAGVQFQASCSGSCIGTIHWSFLPGTQPPGINLTIVAGTLSGIPTATGTFTTTIVATDGATGCTGQATFTIAINPHAVADTYTNLVNNTQAYVTGGTTATPATPAVALSGGVLANDGPSGGVTITNTGTFATTNGGSVTLAADGTFLYTPPLASITADSFNYTLSSDTGATGTPTTATATATLSLANRVWYVKPTAALNGIGQSQSPWNNTSAISGTLAGDIIFVYDNGGSTANSSANIALLTNQQLIGQGVALTVNGNTLVSAASPPLLGGTVTLANGVTVNGIDMSTGTSDAIDGSGVSSVNVTARNVTTTTGTAVNISGSGNSGTMSFTSVSANGGANGIVLQNFSGSFAVTGTGTAGSGGTIAHSTGPDAAVAGNGIYLDTATNISLAYMQLNDFANFAISGNNVTGLALDHVVINGVNGTSTVGAGEGSVAFTGLHGTATVSNCNISGGLTDNFRVFNNSGGSLNRITVTNTTFGPNSTASGNDGLVFQGTNGTLNVTVQNSTFTSARGDLFQLDLHGTVSSDLVFTGNTLSNNHPNIVSGGGGVTIGGGGPGDNPTLTYLIDSNTMRNAVGAALAIGKGSGTGNFNGTISNNTIGASGVANSGSLQGSDISVISVGGGTNTVHITNNQILQYNGSGILLQIGNASLGGNGALNATVTGNTIAQPGTLASNGLFLNVGTVSGDAHQACFTFGGAGALANSITGSGANGATDFRLRERFATTVSLPGYSGANNSNASVLAFVQGNNGGTPTGLVSNNVPTGGGYTGGSPCP